MAAITAFVKQTLTQEPPNKVKLHFTSCSVWCENLRKKKNLTTAGNQQTSIDAKDGGFRQRACLLVNFQYELWRYVRCVW